MQIINRLALVILVFSFSAPGLRAQDAASAPFRRATPAPTPEEPPVETEEAQPSPTPTPAATQKAETSGTIAPAKTDTAAPARRTPTEKAAPKPVAKATATPAVKTDIPEIKDTPADYLGIVRKVRNLESRWENSVVARDANVLEQLVADDFIGTGPGGKVAGKSTLIRETKKDKNNYESAVARKLAVRVFGPQVAVATGVATERGTTAEGRRFEHSYRFTDTWMARRGRWQVIASQTMLLPEQ